VVILTAGTVINATLTRKVPLIVGWLGAFAIQGFVRHWLWGVQLNTALSVMTGVAFILFTNYMITDPGTTPASPRAQFMFGSAVAFTYGALMEFNVVYTLFFAVSIVCAVRGLGWWAAYFIGRRKQRLMAAASGPAASGLAAGSAASGPAAAGPQPAAVDA
jgi:enediyne biosynthesis protein E5